MLIVKNKNKNILLSVVTPVTGRFELFLETLECVKQQTYRNFEWIITDDTPDETLREKNREIIEKFADENPDIQTKYIFTQPRLYQSNNVNQGLNVTEGKFIHILHSDDLIDKHTFELEMDMLSRHPECGCLIYKEKAFANNFQSAFHTGFSILDPAFFMNIDVLIGHPLPCSTVFEKELLFKTELMDPQFKFICDFDMFFQFAKELIKAKKYIIKSNASYIGWRKHQNNVSTSDMVFQKEHLPFMQKIFEMEKEDCIIEGPDLAIFLLKAWKHRIGRIFQLLNSPFKELNYKNIPGLMKIYLKEIPFYKKIEEYKKSLNYPQNTKNKIIEILCYEYGIHLIHKSIRIPGANHEYQINRSSIFLKLEDIPAEKFIEITDLKENYYENAMNCKFNNNFNLFPFKDSLKNYNNIIYSNFNLSRFSKRTVNEFLKYVSPGQNLIFTIFDNQFYNKDALVKFIDKKTCSQLQLEEIKDYLPKNHVLKYKVISNDHFAEMKKFTGISFVLFVQESNVEHITKFIGSVEKQGFENYEIVLAGSKQIDNLDKFNVKFKNISGMNLSQAKNHLSEKALYSDILFINEGLILSDEFKNDFIKQGWHYEIRIPKIVNRNNKRLNDYYRAVNGQEFPMSYRDYSEFTVVNPNISMIKKYIAVKYKWDESQEDYSNIIYSQNINNDDIIIEVADSKVISISNKIPNLEFYPYSNPVYEELGDKIIISKKLYGLRSGILTQKDIV